jgi:preprotein translocase subunit SecE
MATEEDLKKAESEDAHEESSEEHAHAETSGEAIEVRAKSDSETSEDEESEVDDAAPVQLGYQRYVYAAYMAGAMLAGFLAAKIGHAAWYRLGQWKPQFGEPKDEILFPISGVIGILISVYYWRKPEARQYANEVAEELSKVTWPSRKEVTNSTTVVVLTTVFATVFFALMDRFWGFITDKIYTF